jgi:hypothetical protein
MEGIKTELKAVPQGNFCQVPEAGHRIGTQVPTACMIHLNLLLRSGDADGQFTHFLGFNL